jgi:hypothetical protein
LPQLILGGTTTKFRIATSDNYLTLMAYINDNDYYALLLNGSNATFYSQIDGKQTNIKSW